MRLFKLKRLRDVSGVSGTGYPAQGCLFDNGKIALTWLMGVHSVTVFDSIEEVEKIHGHEGATIIEWEDTVYVEKTKCEPVFIPSVTILNQEDLAWETYESKDSYNRKAI